MVARRRVARSLPLVGENVGATPAARKSGRDASPAARTPSARGARSRGAPPLVGARERWDVVVAPRAAARLDVRLVRALSAFAAALVEAPLRQARYVVIGAEGRDVVSSPRP